MATFLTDLMKKGYTQDEIFAVIFESERERKRRRMQAIIIETVAAHRLKKIREFLAYQELATWKRMNGFDRAVECEENRFHVHRSLPPTPEQYAASLRSDLKRLNDAISMPDETETRPRQKTMGVVDGRRSDSLDELLANFEFARTKEWMEKQSREAAQVTVTPVDTVQNSSPCSLDPEPSPDICVNLENSEGRVDLELEELESPSASTGLKTTGQQCPPNEGTWERGRTTANGFLTAGVDSSQGGRIPSPTESEDTRASEKSTIITADTTFLQQGHKPRSEENKQFDPGGTVEKERRPALERGCNSTFFFCGELGGSLLCFVFCRCFVCALFPKLLFLSRRPLLSEAERREGRRGSNH